MVLARPFRNQLGLISGSSIRARPFKISVAHRAGACHSAMSSEQFAKRGAMDEEPIGCSAEPQAQDCESTAITYPDTDSEFGDYTAVCDTWRNTAQTSSTCPRRRAAPWLARRMAPARRRARPAGTGLRGCPPPRWVPRSAAARSE
ncbi:unnamed protein product [Prorocentrum cordatum]|uniref:Uncharacterized protein n=1 Tax=Prorocentrum cordatum TaxID=2364126 RepID=A0ABN9W4P6_9DINO|nr:unnamed protein product [Polarella glacialis]